MSSSDDGTARGDTEPALTVDARGKLCPLPVIELAKTIGGIDVGALIVVLSDDPASRHDIPAWCAMRGHDYVGERSVDGTPAYAVRRLE